MNFGETLSGNNDLNEARRGGLAEGERSYLALEDVFSRKYRHWRGVSGKSYVFSVYPPCECPAYEDAVLIVADRRLGGRASACVDLGALPDTRLAELRRLFADRLDDVEFQIHLLADAQGDRRASIEDISPRAA